MGRIKNPELFLLQLQLYPNHGQEKEQNENTSGHRTQNTRCRMAHALKKNRTSSTFTSKAFEEQKEDGGTNEKTWIDCHPIVIRHTFRYNVITFVVHRSPVRKFAKASEGVGHRHKLPKLVEESNNLISLSIPIQGHGQARRMPVTRNAPFSLVFSAIRKENYQYVFLVKGSE